MDIFFMMIKLDIHKQISDGTSPPAHIRHWLYCQCTQQVESRCHLLRTSTSPDNTRPCYRYLCSHVRYSYRSGWWTRCRTIKWNAILLTHWPTVSTNVIGVSCSIVHRCCPMIAIRSKCMSAVVGAIRSSQSTRHINHFIFGLTKTEKDE